MSDTGLFTDIFRRADKNDDERISLEEFKAFFSDGVLKDEDLESIFKKIDTHNTNNLDHGELCEYFKQHVGPFEPVFAAVDQLNKALQTVTQSTAETYGKANEEQQFMSRFFTREILEQVAAVQRPLDCASDAMETEARSKRIGSDVLTEEHLQQPVLAGRLARRARRALETQISTGPEMSAIGSLGSQVAKLQELVDRLDKRVTLGGIRDEKLDIRDENLVLVVERNMECIEEERQKFREAIKRYVDEVERKDGNRLISVRMYSENSRVRIYEVWDSEESWQRHLRGEQWRRLARCLVDFLQGPEKHESIRLPGSWFEMPE